MLNAGNLIGHSEWTDRKSDIGGAAATVRARSGAPQNVEADSMAAWDDTDSENLKKVGDLLTTVLLEGFRGQNAARQPESTIDNNSIRGVNRALDDLNLKVNDQTALLTGVNEKLASVEELLGQLIQILTPPATPAGGGA